MVTSAWYGGSCVRLLLVIPASTKIMESQHQEKLLYKPSRPAGAGCRPQIKALVALEYP